MLKEIDNCVGCRDLGLRCMGNSCPNRPVEVMWCDCCDNNIAKYHFVGFDYCTECAEEKLEEIFKDMSVFEKASALEINIDYANRG